MKTNKYQWYKSIFISLLLHCLVLLLIVQYTPEQETPPNKTAIIKSYLYTQKKPRYIMAPESKRLTNESNVITKKKGPLLDTKPKQSEQIKQHLDKTESNFTTPINTGNQNKAVQEVNSKRILKKFRERLSSNNSQLWAAHKQQSSDSKRYTTNEYQSDFDTGSQDILSRPLLGKISSLKQLSISADNTRYIKYGERCFAVKLDNKQSATWINATCPLSADPNRQLLRDSLNKYLPIKTK